MSGVFCFNGVLIVSSLSTRSEQLVRNASSNYWFESNSLDHSQYDKIYQTDLSRKTDN
jgi:hypothetical protein